MSYKLEDVMYAMIHSRRMIMTMKDSEQFLCTIMTTRSTTGVCVKCEQETKDVLLDDIENIIFLS